MIQTVAGRQEREKELPIGAVGLPLRCAGGRPGGLAVEQSEQVATHWVPLNRDKSLLCGFLHPMFSMTWGPGQQTPPPHPPHFGLQREGREYVECICLLQRKVLSHYPYDLAQPPFPLSPQAWLSEGRCVREVTEPGALRMEPGDPITIIEGR